MIKSKKLSKFRDIEHAFFNRLGGKSNGIYKSLNCGIGSSDKKKDVLKNISIVCKKIGVSKNKLVLLNQVHSNKFLFINKKYKLNKKKFKGDALISNTKKIAIGVLSADCVPILIYDEANQIIATVHAGWKGAVGGIIENTIKEIVKIGGNNKINVAIGPCINANNYEVGQDFYDKFIQASKKNENYFLPTKKNKFLFDLRKYVNSKFEKLEVNHIENIDFDTFSETEKFFSFRRSTLLGENHYGRCISLISLIND